MRKLASMLNKRRAGRGDHERRPELPPTVRIARLFSILAGLCIAFGITPSAAAKSMPGGWRVIETEHFRIAFTAEDAASAAEIAGFCEAVYEEVTAFYDSYPAKALCVLRGDTAFANGSYRPDPPHINIVTAAPSGPSIKA